MTIRQLSSEDRAAFMDLRTEGLHRDPDSFRVTIDDDEALGEIYWADRLDRDVVVGFEHNGELLGIGGLQRFSGEKLAHKALIWGMYVRPTARGSGVADAVVKALINLAPVGVRQLQLTVMAHNMRARSLYERHGFMLFAIEPASVRIGDQFLDEALMWRPLG
jgi:ribosomal protein S18 acetylase RimI-like enzyme